METIRSASFNLCLDCGTDGFNAHNTETLLAKSGLQILNGKGTDGQGANRWYDKTLQFIVSDNGLVGLNIEHSVAEGIVIIRLVEHALKYVRENLAKKLYTTLVPKPRQFVWEINKEVDEMIQTASKDHDKLSQDMELEILIWDEFGKEFIKSMRISPDAFIQLTLQLAYYRTHNKLVSTYESASIRRFREGRVDNIRSAHPPALRWVSIMNDDTADSAKKFKAFKDALDKQIQVMKENVTGYGLDNHLCALSVLNKTEHDMFKDPVYAEIIRFPLSTSQVATSVDGSYLCYGPVVYDGYGCAYNPSPNRITFAVSSFNNCQTTDIHRFKRNLAKALADMKTFLLEHQPSPPQPNL